MVEKYRTLLADNAGLKSVTVDGQSVSYGDLEGRLRYWEGRVAAESGRRPQPQEPGGCLVSDGGASS